MNYKSTLDAWLFAFFVLPLLMAPLSTAGVSIAGGVFFLLYLVSGHWRRWRQAAMRPWFWPLLAILAVNLLGMLWTEDLRRGWELVSKLNCFFFALAGATLPWTKSRFAWVVRLFLAGLFLNAIVGFLQWFDLYPWRPMIPIDGPSGYTDRIFLSMALTNAILWMLYDLKHRVILPRWLNGALIVVFFLHLAISEGRAGQLAFVVFVPLAVWLLYPGRWRGWAMGGVALVIVALAAVPSVQKRAEEGIANLQQYEQGKVDTSMGLRLVYWQGALEMLRRHPLLGVGTGDYRREMAHLQRRHVIPQTPASPVNDNPHNSYLAYLADLGVIGFAALLWFLAAVTREAWRHRESPVGWFKLSYMAIFLLGSLTDSLIWGFDNALMLCLFAALPALMAGEPKPAPAAAKEALRTA